MIKSILRFLLHFFWLFKIKDNKVFFESYDGTQYSCNPKILFEKMQSNNKYKCVWYLKKDVSNINEDVCFVRIKRKNLLYYYHILTSRVLVTNINFSSFIPFRKKQILINTWHGGGAYKFAIYQKTRDSIGKAYAKFNYFLSSSNIFAEKVIKDTFQFNGTILSYGLPRNDLLFEDSSIIRESICKQLSIDSNYLIVLYAPTYRDNGMSKSFETIDFKRLTYALETRFNKRVIVLCRAHHFSNDRFVGSESIINVSCFPDMQQLLASCDILITDYSSCMWDYSLTFKPCFLFAPDYSLYSEKRSFYTNINEWGFPFAFSNDELVDIIVNYDESSFKSNVEKMHDSFGNVEKGIATKTLVAFITEFLNGSAKS